jgi:glutaredoxin
MLVHFVNVTIVIPVSHLKIQMIISTLVFVGVSVFSFYFFWQEKNVHQLSEGTQTTQEQQTNRVILYYANGCPHCAAVETYLNQNQIKNKITFDIKEVNHNSSNAKDLQLKAKICGLPNDAIRVPFLWDGEKCLIGDQVIIDFFKQKTEAK